MVWETEKKTWENPKCLSILVQYTVEYMQWLKRTRPLLMYEHEMVTKLYYGQKQASCIVLVMSKRRGKDVHILSLYA